MGLGVLVQMQQQIAAMDRWEVICFRWEMMLEFEAIR
jgi:hypothetical protein